MVTNLSQILELGFFLALPVFVLLPLLYHFLFRKEKKCKVCKDHFAGYHSKIYQELSDSDLRLLEVTVKNTVRNSHKKVSFKESKHDLHSKYSIKRISTPKSTKSEHNKEKKVVFNV